MCTPSNIASGDSAYLTKSKTHALSKEEYGAIVSQPCHYCGKPTVPDHHYNGLDRLDSTVRVYTPGSCVAACGTCNTMKWRRSPEAFIARCAAVATFATREVVTCSNHSSMSSSSSPLFPAACVAMSGSASGCGDS